MPTSSQSQILSVVDHQLHQHQQQQSISQDGITIKPSGRTPGVEAKRRRSRDDQRPSTGRKDDEEKQSPSPPNTAGHRRSSIKMNDKNLKTLPKIQKSTRRAQSAATSRTSQRNDVLHVSVVNLNSKSHIQPKTPRESSPVRRNSSNIDYQNEIEYKLKQLKANTTSMGANSSFSDLENHPDDEDEDEENGDVKRRPSLLNNNTRRLLVLGTIRPSRSFYRDLPASDIEHLMEYFQRMRNANRRITSEEINQELKTKSTEYKPKIFYDSTIVTKSQVNNIEKLLEPYAEKIRTHNAELVKLENPFRFVIKSMNSDTPLIIIPREYNDCLLALVSRSDPLRKSDLITALISDKLSEDVKANALDISYFPGGVNYDVPHDEIDENGQMQIDTYQKLKRRLNIRKIWHFTGPPEKKPHAVVAILPANLSSTIDHQRLLDCLDERLKSSSTDDEIDIEQRIISMEFIPLSCMLDSHEISDQFIIDCNSNETKKQLMDKPLKLNLSKHSITIEVQSYDEQMHTEYTKSLKAEKYRELIKNHDDAVKRASKK